MPDPRFTIVERTAGAMRVRATLYGGPVKIKGFRANAGCFEYPGRRHRHGDGHCRPDNSQRMRWGQTVRDLLARRMHYYEVYALAEEYVRLYGVCETRHLPGDDVLLKRFRAWALQRAEPLRHTRVGDPPPERRMALYLRDEAEKAIRARKRRERWPVLA